MIVYLARDIPAFVMYCVNGESDSSLLIESTDSDNLFSTIYKYNKRYLIVIGHLILNNPIYIIRTL